MASTSPQVPMCSTHAQGSNAARAGKDENAPIWCQRLNSDWFAESPWARKIILSLDGGGVRGYASLLILKQLMAHVESIEMNENTDDAPHAYRCDSSASYSWSKPPVDSLEPEPNHNGYFWPHHYIDYFFGTSTGGLSAIMLGRLQFTAQEALDKYHRLASDVFGHPRRVPMSGYRTPRFDEKRLAMALQRASENDRLDVPQRSHEHTDNRDEEAIRMLIARKADGVQLKDRHPDKPRTAVVAYGGSGTHEIRLFRSYDHPNFGDEARATPKKKHFQPLTASTLPLWKVGRATSAAPGYFRPMRINDEKLLDGAVGGQNNPAKLAYYEVKHMHWRHLPSMVISIGTGVKLRKKQLAKKKRWKTLLQFQNLQEIVAAMQDMKRSILESETRHYEFEEEIEGINQNLNEDQKVRYYRFNIPEELNLTDTKLGQWEGEDGATTVHRITQIVERYVHIERDRLRECARELVKRRRRRQVTERWERFALHLIYRCPEKDNGCNGPEFDSRSKLRQHAIREHGFVWKVPCIDSNNVTTHEWSCFWDQCGESQVSVFYSEAQFLSHIQGAHGKQHAKVVSDREFEDWLDRGRNYQQPLPSRQVTGLSGHEGISRRQTAISRNYTGIT